MASQTACASRVVLQASISSATTSSASTRQQPALKSAGASSAFFGNGVSMRSAVRLAASKPVVTSATATFEKMGADVANKTYYPNGEDSANANKKWYIIDAEGKTLGRLATVVANHLRGANLPTYTPSMDMGGYVVVINAEKVQVTGNKNSQKLYRRHTTGRPGKMKVETFDQLQARIPERIIEKAVKGMLTKGSLGRTLFTHMKVYAGSEHPHAAQEPVDITEQINKKLTQLSPNN
eukprot:CAMPEP_0118935390 /NCGR_PEP_ID=MMETSP1169-20130426/15608_1 /TAXON_ID=36882 /ORGANISM="Pyramimonas obovata, Strain CCMP722" /LENGTH=236 /DNA_ID=CAMNT_0006878425 /DNA_START=67 /DNA_END=777 /DNA_ORIENTATION=+